MKLEISWQIEDGYVGKARPQELTFDTDDYTDNEEEWNKLTEEEQREYIHEAVQEDFENTVTWSINSIREVRE